MIEQKSLEIIRELLPNYWTIREYKPDYGLDLSVEVFEPISEENFETLGEHFFIQAKGTENLKKGILKIKSENNVEKKTLYSKPEEDTKEIEVVKFQIETSELCTIERMSASIPVFLFVIDIIKKNIYFVCLNDYIDKVITPHEPDYMKKETKTIYIPIENVINKNGIEILKFYSKRPKLYSFFTKVEYQHNELAYINDEELKKIYPYFIDRILRYDIWSLRNTWGLINMYYEKILMLKEKNTLPEMKSIHKISEELKKETWTTGFSTKEFTYEEAFLYMNIRTLWQGLASIVHVYEEDCREWFLPTYFSVSVRY